MFKASKIAFMPALALHIAMPRPMTKANVNFPSLPAAIRTICSLMSS